ncbi:autophagy-related 13 [Arctopsyche grandis]|uniref:autophagy-related 13 n=1 Tax=Arctopsyche grandis TaxID=121162 RepID=UPI00406D805C
MAAAPKLTALERKDLDKFTKYLALKSVQVIVQSRLGDKVHTSSKPHTSATDWFSLDIQDIPDVNVETKKVLQGDPITSCLPLCVEISLKTVDGDQMILENWMLGVLPDQCDPSVKVTCTVYNRMSIMLKSLISVTRVTPAYKLSRRQGSDSYVIYYRIYMGEPQFQNLGDGYKQFRVGQLCGPLDTLYLTVAYRTKMTITPIQAQQETSIMVKSDHFHSDLSPKHIRYNKQSDKKKVNLDKPMRAGAFVDMSKITQFKETDFILPEDPPFSWLLEDPRRRGDNFDYSKIDSSEDQFNFKDDEDSGNVNDDDDLLDIQENLTSEERTPSWSPKESIRSKPDDDKFMKELSCPFATAGPFGELAQFYRECHHAPPLQSFMGSEVDEAGSVPKLEDPTIDITKQLEMFETSLLEYDKMVSALCQSPNNN